MKLTRTEANLLLQRMGVAMKLTRTEIKAELFNIEGQPDRLTVIPSGYKDVYLAIDEDEAYNIGVRYLSEEEYKALLRECE